MSTLDSTRREFLKATTVAGAAATAAVGVGATGLMSKPDEAHAAAAIDTKIVKSTCHQCPARCGIDVRVENGNVTGITGSLEHPISNGKLCPKGPLGVYMLYDPDRHTGPMKRTNPAKGRDVDPKYVPITWEEALDTLSKRLNTLREKGEAHRFSITLGRGWAAQLIRGRCFKNPGHHVYIRNRRKDHGKAETTRQHPMHHQTIQSEGALPDALRGNALLAGQDIAAKRDDLFRGNFGQGIRTFGQCAPDLAQSSKLKIGTPVHLHPRVRKLHQNLIRKSAMHG